MNLKDDKQQNIQRQLDFSSALTGEAREAGRGGTEASGAMNGTENPASTNRLMEEVCERENLKAALRRVKANKGSPGVDGMTVIGIKDYLKQHWPAIREQLLNGTYEPKPVRRVEIAKQDGGMRKLGIPTVLDRFIQQAVMQVLQRQWDRTFSDYSYGFRPGRSAHQAVAKAQQYIAEGRGWCVDLDLEKFLDTSSYCPHVHEMLSNRSGWLSITLIRRPLRRPLVTSTASSSPRFTRCNTVWRETPSFIVVSSMGRYSGGASTTKRARNSSVMRICQGAPGVTCSPAMKPSLSHRCIVEVLIPRIFAACRMDASSPADCSVGG